MEHADIIFRKKTFRIAVLVESRFPRVVSLKRCCGFSIPVRSGTCCRKAIRTTKLYIGAFRLGAAMKFCVACGPMLPTNFATEVHSMKKNASLTRASLWRKAAGQRSEPQSAEKA